jgi:hypothetical protein
MPDYFNQKSEVDINNNIESSSQNGEIFFNSDQQNHTDNEIVSFIKIKKRFLNLIENNYLLFSRIKETTLRD